MHRFFKVFLIGILMAVFFMGCSSFKVNDPITGNNLVETNGAPLLTRKDDFEVERTWLDENNNLTTFKVRRNTDESADAQIEAMRIMADTLKSGSTTSIIP